MNHPTPTDEGLRRYPYTQGYHADLSRSGPHPDYERPCTCLAVCEPRCAGECGCRACSLQFQEFADEAGFFHYPDDGVMDEEAALRAYREVTDGRVPSGADSGS